MTQPFKCEFASRVDCDDPRVMIAGYPYLARLGPVIPGPGIWPSVIPRQLPVITIPVFYPDITLAALKPKATELHVQNAGS